MQHIYCIYVFSDTPYIRNTVTVGAVLPSVIEPIVIEPTYYSYTYQSCYKYVCRYENKLCRYKNNLFEDPHFYAITEDGVVVTIMLADSILDSSYEGADEFVEVY